MALVRTKPLPRRDGAISGVLRGGLNALADRLGGFAGRRARGRAGRYAARGAQGELAS